MTTCRFFCGYMFSIFPHFLLPLLTLLSLSYFPLWCSSFVYEGLSFWSILFFSLNIFCYYFLQRMSIAPKTHSDFVSLKIIISPYPWKKLADGIEFSAQKMLFSPHCISCLFLHEWCVWLSLKMICLHAGFLFVLHLSGVIFS